MNLPLAPGDYAVADQTRLRAELRQADAENYKRGRDLVLAPGQRLVVPEESTGELYQIRIVGGAVVASPL